MNKILKALAVLSCAVSLAACQTVATSVCDGHVRLTPNKGTVNYITVNDLAFAQQVALNNRIGKGCK